MDLKKKQLFLELLIDLNTIIAVVPLNVNAILLQSKDRDYKVEL